MVGRGLFLLACLGLQRSHAVVLLVALCGLRQGLFPSNKVFPCLIHRLHLEHGSRTVLIPPNPDPTSASSSCVPEACLQYFQRSDPRKLRRLYWQLVGLQPNNQTPAGYASKNYGPPTHRTIVCYEHQTIVFLDHLDLFFPRKLQLRIHQFCPDRLLWNFLLGAAEHLWYNALAGIVRSPLAAGTDLKKSEAPNWGPPGTGIPHPLKRQNITGSQAVELKKLTDGPGFAISNLGPGMISTLQLRLAGTKPDGEEGWLCLVVSGLHATVLACDGWTTRVLWSRETAFHALMHQREQLIF